MGLLLAGMVLLHRYIFLYADDLYYCRKAGYGWGHLPYATLAEIKTNGRLWIGPALFAALKNEIYTFRILNPVMVVLTAILLAGIGAHTGTTDALPGARRSIHQSLSPGPLHDSDNSNKNLAVLCAGLFFWLLPILISHTTVYYAACAFNYLYPTALVMLYGYLLYLTQERYNAGRCSAVRISLVILAFLAGSSTQQTAMIALGYTVLLTLYSKFRKKQPVLKRPGLSRFLPYYAAWLAGFGFIVYGSVSRMLYERQVGNEVVLSEVVHGLLTVNIFSTPVALFVLLTGVCCLAWLKHYHSRHISLMLYIALSAGLPGYIAVVYFIQPSVNLFSGSLPNLALSLSIVLFTLVYVAGILYSGLLIMRHQGYPFILFSGINAVGAQLMMLAVNARFAYAYKIIFPSLLLLSVFIIYTVVQFRRDRMFLGLTALVLVLSFAFKACTSAGVIPGLISDIIVPRLGITGFNVSAVAIPAIVIPAIAIPFAVLLIIFSRSRYFRHGIAILFIVAAFLNFGQTYAGYKSVAEPQNYNLNAIRQYRQSADKSVLVLKQVPYSLYGYNLGVWREAPDYLRGCYKIDPETVIEYMD